MQGSVRYVFINSVMVAKLFWRW